MEEITPWNIYCKRGKIRWAKLSRISPNSRKNIRSALSLQHLNNAIIRSLYNIHGKNFVMLLKTTKV